MKHDTHTGNLDTSVEGDLVATHTLCNVIHVLSGKITLVGTTCTYVELTKTKLRKFSNAENYHVFLYQVNNRITGR